MDLRHRFAYDKVRAFSGPDDSLLEVGCGEGYGSLIVEGWVRSYCGVGSACGGDRMKLTADNLDDAPDLFAIARA